MIGKKDFVYESKYIFKDTFLLDQVSHFKKN